MVEIGSALYLTYFREHFWDAISHKQSADFLYQLILFTGVALVICFVSGVSGYLMSLASIKWRQKLNIKAFAVREQKNIENIGQRIQDDCMSYPDLFLNLIFGTVKAGAYVVIFGVTLFLSFSWWYLLVVLMYAAIGTVITHWIAKPLIALNYKQQRVEATYRNSLTIDNFSDCIHVMLGLAKKQKHLTYFQQFYSQVGVIIPLVVVAPIYFTTNMTLGTLMRFNSTFSTILDNMSYGINSFSSINRFLSCRKRLKEARII